MLWFIVPAVAGALVLERLRPYTGQPEHLDTEDTTQFRHNLTRTMRSGFAYVYSDIQNPAYVSLLSIVLPAVMFVAAVLQAATMPVWSTLMLIVIGILLASLYGGLRTHVTRECITIHMGMPVYRVLRLSPAEAADVRLRTYMPLKEFGGYGVRTNREMTVYYLSAGTGVLITTRDGKRHFIGSNPPERLADVIRAAAGLPAVSWPYSRLPAHSSVPARSVASQIASRSCPELGSAACSSTSQEPLTATSGLTAEIQTASLAVNPVEKETHEAEDRHIAGGPCGDRT